MRKATHYRRPSESVRFISIHALREEGDQCARTAGRIRNHFYPRPPRGGRHHQLPAGEWAGDISIHALREEGDLFPLSRIFAIFSISIHALRATPSARRATCLLGVYYHLVGNFYPRPPRGGRPVLARMQPTIAHISIHALREEGDSATISCCRGFITFLSTPSARRATV